MLFPCLCSVQEAAGCQEQITLYSERSSAVQEQCEKPAGIFNVGWAKPTPFSELSSDYTVNTHRRSQQSNRDTLSVLIQPDVI